MPIVSEALGALVPRFAWLGYPSATYPYPFVGYRRLPGVGADQVAIPDTASLAADIGGMLDRVHRIDTDRIPPPPVSSEGRFASHWLANSHPVS